MSSKTKKVHYERGTKTGSHRSSRDSGLGSASDRASLGTGVDDVTDSYQDLQRHDVDALQEALDAAYDTSNHPLYLSLFLFPHGLPILVSSRFYLFLKHLASDSHRIHVLTSMESSNSSQLSII